MFCFRGGLWIALCACLLVQRATAYMYDEIQIGDLDLDDNYVDMGPLATSEDPMKALLLQTFIQSLENEDHNRIPQIDYGSKLDLNDPSNHSMMKRVTLQGTIAKRPPKVFRPIIKSARKWQTKKGKPLGSQMICYFKLCAFRRPVK